MASNASTDIVVKVHARSGKPYRMSAAAHGLQAIVAHDRRVIGGVAIATKGPVRGHQTWLDATALSQIAGFGNAAPRGIKCRFTHPGIYSDGLGKFLGRFRNFRLEGDVVRADLHFSDVTDQSPEFEKDPANYLMGLAKTDPDAFGSSIVFYHDADAEDRFIADHENGDGKFVSPDANNTQNYYHTRIAKLNACDIVDDAAANAGFFSLGDEAASRAESVLSWLLQVEGADVPPGPEVLGRGVEPERMREFFDGFLARHGLAILSVVTEEDVPMTESELKAKQDEAAQKARAETLARLKGLTDAFPGDEAFALSAFAKGLDLIGAKAEQATRLSERLAAKDAEIVKLNERIGELVAENEGIRATLLSGAEPASHGTEPQPLKFEQIVDAYRAAHPQASYAQAVSILAKVHPNEYAAAERGEE